MFDYAYEKFISKADYEDPSLAGAYQQRLFSLPNLLYSFGFFQYLFLILCSGCPKIVYRMQLLQSANNLTFSKAFRKIGHCMNMVWMSEYFKVVTVNTSHLFPFYLFVCSIHTSGGRVGGGVGLVHVQFPVFHCSQSKTWISPSLAAASTNCKKLMINSRSGRVNFLDSTYNWNSTCKL